MAAREESKGRAVSEKLLNLYADLLKEICEEASALIGGGILGLLFKSAIRKTGEKHPFLLSLEISEEGVNLETLREKARGMAPSEIHRGFQNLITQLFDLFTALADGILSRRLFPRVLPTVRQADRMVTQK